MLASVKWSPCEFNMEESCFHILNGEHFMDENVYIDYSIDYCGTKQVKAVSCSFGRANIVEKCASFSFYVFICGTL